MGSPVTGTDFEIQNFGGDVCEQIKKLLDMNSTMKTWFDWAFKSDGNITSAFAAEFASNFMPVGGIIFLPLDVTETPSGFLPCDGRTVNRVTYANLFDKFGTTFGVGDGINTFNLPNLEERFLFGMSATHSATSVGGAKTVALTVEEINHRHIFGRFQLLTNDDGSFTTAISANETEPDLAARQITGATNAATTANLSTMSGEYLVTSKPNIAVSNPSAHQNMPPFFSGTWLVKT